MSLPASLFLIIDPMMTLLLRSPLHGLMSASVLLLSFQGRRTGPHITLALRYARSDAGFVCFTTDNAKWWRNFEDARPVAWVVAGETLNGVASARRVTVGESLDALRSFLAAFPSDATHHDVSVVHRVPSESDLSRTPTRSIRVQVANVRATRSGA